MISIITTISDGSSVVADVFYHHILPSYHNAQDFHLLQNVATAVGDETKGCSRDQ